MRVDGSIGGLIETKGWEILARLVACNMLPKIISNQHFNEYIKDTRRSFAIYRKRRSSGVSLEGS